MKIQKGIVKYKDRNDIVCFYGITDDGRQYYFLDETDEKKFSNGNRIASKVLVEAIDPMVTASNIGVVDEAGNEVITFDNKSIRPINDDIILVEKATPITQTVIAANELRKDPAFATQLVSTPATIKAKLSEKMGAEGRYLFNDQFSEATICDINGNNLVNNEYFSFIGMTKEKLYLCKNTIDSLITEYAILSPDIQSNIASKNNNDIDVKNFNVEKSVVENALTNKEETQNVEVQTAVRTDDIFIPSIDSDEIQSLEEDNTEKLSSNLPTENLSFLGDSKENLISEEENKKEIIPQVEEDLKTNVENKLAEDEILEENINEEKVLAEDEIENINDETDLTSETKAKEVLNEEFETSSDKEVPFKESLNDKLENLDKQEDSKEKEVLNEKDNKEENDLSEETVSNKKTMNEDNINKEVSKEEMTSSEKLSDEKFNFDLEDEDDSREELNLEDEGDSHEELDLEDERKNIKNKSKGSNMDYENDEIDELMDLDEDEKGIDELDDFEDSDLKFDNKDDDDIFKDSIFKADKIINDYNDNYEEDFKKIGFNKSDTIMTDVAKSMANLIKQNKDQKNIIGKYQERFERINSTRRSILDKVKVQEKKIEVLTNKIRSMEKTMNSLENKNQILENKNRDQEKLITSLNREIEVLRPQLAGKEDLVKVLADAQVLLGEKTYDYNY